LVGISACATSAPREAARSPASSTPHLVSHDAAGEVNVRGKTVDEALDLVIAALDRAMLAGAPTLRIIHGHGTGRLKATLRAHLKTSAYVATFRPGSRSEGGDGVTIAQLK
jgi:DNA mismatch repair protein MutS2